MDKAADGILKSSDCLRRGASVWRERQDKTRQIPGFNEEGNPLQFEKKVRSKLEGSNAEERNLPEVLNYLHGDGTGKLISVSV